MVIMYQGALAPEQYVLNITPGDSGLDLSTVSSASFKVRLPDGSTTTWSGVISNQSSSALTVTHTMPATAPSDVSSAGIYSLYCQMVCTSGVARTQPQELLVKGQYDYQ